MSTIQQIDLGSGPDTGTGDPIRTGGSKINSNFSAVNLLKRTGTDLSPENVGDNYDFNTGLLKDQYVTAGIGLGESGEIALTGFTKISLIGALNELKTEIGNEDLWDRVSTTISPKNVGDTLDMGTGGVISDSIITPSITAVDITGISLKELGGNQGIYIENSTGHVLIGNAPAIFPTAPFEPLWVNGTINSFMGSIRVQTYSNDANSKDFACAKTRSIDGSTPGALLDNDVMGRYGAGGDKGDLSIPNNAEMRILADGNFTLTSTPSKFVFQTTPAGSTTRQDRLVLDNAGNLDLLVGNLDINSGSLILALGTNVNNFSTDGTLSGDSDNTVSTEKAVKTYVDGVVNATIILQGDWNANTNTPDITTTTTTGYAWRVSVSGSTDLGGINSWVVGDLAVKTATGWLKIDNQDIAAVWGNISGTLSSQTDLQDALNAKENTLTKGNLTEATSSVLTITGGTASIIGSGLTIEVDQADASNDGYLSSSDWNTFNGKQDVLTNGVDGLTSAEVLQLANIGTTTISDEQWEYVGSLTDSPIIPGDSIDQTSYLGISEDASQLPSNNNFIRVNSIATDSITVSYETGGATGNNDTIWQSFTAVEDTLISQVAFNINTPFGQPSTFTLYEGEGLGGVVLDTFTVTSLASGWVTLDLSSRIPVINGNKYTISLVSGGLNISTFIDLPGGYTGGTSIFSGADLQFRIYKNDGLDVFLVDKIGNAILDNDLTLGGKIIHDSAALDIQRNTTGRSTLSVTGNASNARVQTTYGGDINAFTQHEQLATSSQVNFGTSISTYFINTDKKDVDFVVRGTVDSNLFFIDAGNNRVGFGTSTPSTLIDIKGGQTVNITTVNASTYDLDIDDYILNVTYPSTGAVTSLTLLTAQNIIGRIITIKDASGNASINNITIDTEGSELIDGDTTAIISGDYDAITLYSDGSNWFII